MIKMFFRVIFRLFLREWVNVVGFRRVLVGGLISEWKGFVGVDGMVGYNEKVNMNNLK